MFSEKQEFIVLLFNHIGQPSYGQYEATSHGQDVNSIQKILILPKYLATYSLQIDTGSVLGKEKLR